ncbi:MAG: UDP-N-acetylmuramoyl-L-alanyl-D-glutamate--2,6-diaminopimelate ligase [Candidatus Promineifilaceae bacterium]
MEDRETTLLSTMLSRWEAAVEGTSLPQPPVYDGPDVPINELIEHTDYVKPGCCFIARVRTGSDGHPFIRNAVAAGASLIIGQRDIEELDVELGSVPYLQVQDSAIAEAWLSAAMYEFPSRHLVTIGVTGTDGKTTTTNLIFQVLRSADVRVGMLSTIKASIGGSEESLALHVTTPEAPVIQRYLRKMVDAGLTHCVLEVTSHSLAQHRVAAIEFDVAVLTNITHEHMDYHGDFQGYFDAKARLFRVLDGPIWNLKGENEEKEKIEKSALLNLDNQSFELVSPLIQAKQFTYSIRPAGDVVAEEIRYSASSTSYELRLPDDTGDRYPVKTSLVGEFNVHNTLAAAGVGYILGLSPEEISRGIGTVDVLSGRMESIDGGQDFHVIVDFAHTPNALEKAINAAQSMTDGRIITVFGSAGKRDVAKRRLMAEISARDADFTVLTVEDPRTESLDGILRMMADGCANQGGIEGKDFWRVRDRGQAIYFALSLARPDDLVLICGKGHEQSMCFETVEYPWDDRQATRTALEALHNGEPMADLGLPTFEDGS